MKYNHYWGSPVPGCLHYIVEVQIIYSSNNSEIGKTSVMACSKQHAICLVKEELQNSRHYKGEIIKFFRAWFQDDEIPN